MLTATKIQTIESSENNVLEVFKDIVCYEGIYQVSNLGRVKSLERQSLNKKHKRILKEMYLKPAMNAYGYLVVYLYLKEKIFNGKMLHRLMAEAFIPNPENKAQVNHKNGIRNDNRLENLEWITAQDNTIHSYEKLRGKLSSNVDYSLNKKYFPENDMSDFEYEIWRDVVDYECLYKISNLGRVKTVNRKYVNSRGQTKFIREKILTISLNNHGYPMCFLTKNKKTKNKSIHRLIGFAFIPNPDNKPFINHKNGIRTDHRIENLEWCTAQENVIHSYKVLGKIHNCTGDFNRCGKNVAQYDLDGNLINIFKSTMDGQRVLGINNTHISDCCNNKKYPTGTIKKTAGGFMFRYFDEKPLEKIEKYIKIKIQRPKKIKKEKQYIKTYIPDLDGEIWGDVYGYEGLYKISNIGRIKILERKYTNTKNEHRIVKENILKNKISRGYYSVHLIIKNKTKNKSVHRLIAEAFIPNPENKPCVYHIDRNRLNNSVENLAWCTRSENTIRSYNVYNRKMSGFIAMPRKKKKVAQYDLEGNFIQYFESIESAARGVNAKTGSISSICNMTIKTDKYGVEFRDKTSKGFMFRFFEDKPLIKIDKHIKVGCRKKQGIIVLDLKKNIIGKFNSVQEASIKLNLTENGVYRVLREERKHYKGYTFKKIKKNVEYKKLAA